MEQHTSAKSAVIIPVVALLVGAAVGFALGGGQARTETAKLQAQIEKAKKSFPQIPELRSLSGKVTHIAGNTITLETSYPDTNPFESLPKERTITISGTTKVVAYEQKDQVAVRKEMEDFMKNLRTARPADADARPTPPTPYTEKSASASDIKEGMMISVEADENIKDKTSFTASKIVVTLEAPRVVAPVTAPTVPVKVR